jgi:SAM-dependent methyltransferase
MHLEARRFTERVKALFPAFFTGGKRVLDVGSGDINGNNRFLFDASCHYEGIDVAEGPNVTTVCPAGDFRPTESAVYDAIISTECFEHDIDFVRSFRNIVRLLKPGGLFVFTCASTGRAEHGTARCHVAASLSTKIDVNSETWYPNYYRNLTPDDVQRAVPIHAYFDSFAFETDRKACDMYFWGVRNAHPLDPTSLTPEARSLTTMESAYSGDATITRGPAVHRYTRQYHAILDRYRYATGVRTLELGVGSAASLRAMRAYMPNATHVVGVDPRPLCKAWASAVDHIYVETGSLTDPAFLQGISNRYGPFDIVINNDQGHMAEDLAKSFEIMFPLIKDGGVYIAEDTVCMRDPFRFRRNPGSPDHVTYFQHLVLLLNQWNASTPGYAGPHGHCTDPDKIVKKGGTDPIEASIDSILFGVSFVAVSKRVRRHWLREGTPVPAPVRF